MHNISTNITKSYFQCAYPSFYPTFKPIKYLYQSLYNPVTQPLTLSITKPLTYQTNHPTIYPPKYHTTNQITHPTFLLNFHQIILKTGISSSFLLNFAPNITLSYFQWSHLTFKPISHQYLTLYFQMKYYQIFKRTSFQD